MGAILGGVLTALAKGFRGHYRWIAFFIAAVGLALASTGMMARLQVGLLTMFIMGVSMSMTNIPVLTYTQTIVNKEMLGRVMSLFSMMSMGLGPVSYALSSFILQQQLASPRALIFTGGLVMTILGLSTLLLRDFREMEENPVWKNLQGAK